MKKNIIAAMTLALSFGVLHTTYAQSKPGVGIGAKKVNDSAVLEIKSDDKGVLIPRMALKDLKTFGLAGGSNTESMLIYNNLDTKEIPSGFYYWSGATTAQWELITSESRLNTIIENLRKEIYEEIEKITKIPGSGTDLSYLVAFTPSTDDPSKGKFSYLVPTVGTDKKITYTLKEITLEDIIKGTETETFMLPVKGNVTDGKGGTKEVTLGYRYFNEKVIKEWRKTNPTAAIETIDPALGFYIDVASIAGDTFIEHLTENKEFIENTFINIEGNVTLHKDPDGKYYFVSKNPDKTTTTTYFNEMEFKTTLKTGEVTADGVAPSFAANSTAPDTAKIKKGEIFYEYVTEGKNGEEVNYINLTQDLITTINNNTKLQEDITNIVNNFLEGGSNVYFGKIDTTDTTAKDILFSVDKAGKRTPIDISQNIINEITNNTEVQNTIKKVTRLDIVTDSDKLTNTFVNNKPVYRGTQTVSVVDDKPSTLSVPVTIQPKKEVKTSTGETEFVIDSTIEIGRLLSIQVLDPNGSVLVNTFTDAIVGPKTFNFDFGQGIMYLNLPAGNYQLIYEYIAK
ncbi:hypothetical protein ACYSNM_07470 [Myroides sp. LJL116]